MQDNITTLPSGIQKSSCTMRRAGTRIHFIIMESFTVNSGLLMSPLQYLRSTLLLPPENVCQVIQDGEGLPPED